MRASPLASRYPSIFVQAGRGPMPFRSDRNSGPEPETENMPGPEWHAHQFYPRFRDIDEGDPFSRREANAYSKTVSMPGSASEPSRPYPRFAMIDEPDGETPAKSKATESDANRSNRSGNNRKLALAGVMIAGALAVSIGLTLRGAPSPPPRQDVKPLPPITSQTNRIASGEAVRPQVVPGTQPSVVGEADAAVPAVVKPRAKPGPATHASKRKSAQPAALAASPATPRSRSGRSCNGAGGLALARCMRPEILDADRQLRDAYHDAVRAGVERDALVAYRRQWSMMRQRAISDPRGVAAGYRQMADELYALQADLRADDF